MNMGSEQSLEGKKEGGALIRGEALIRDYTVSRYTIFESCSGTHEKGNMTSKA